MFDIRVIDDLHVANQVIEYDHEVQEEQCKPNQKNTLVNISQVHGRIFEKKRT